MFKKIVGVSLVLLVCRIAVASVPGEQSLECHAPDSTVTRVYLDIWMVGHPMGGLGSYDGIMSVDGHKAVATASLNPVGFMGSTEDLSEMNYNIHLGGLLNVGLNIDVQTVLQHGTQALGPMPAGPWISDPIICRWVQ